MFELTITPRLTGNELEPAIHEKIREICAERPVLNAAERVAFRQGEFVRKFAFRSALEQACIKAHQEGTLTYGRVLQILDQQHTADGETLAELNRVAHSVDVAERKAREGITLLFRKAFNAELFKTQELRRAQEKLGEARKSHQPARMDAAKLKKLQNAGLSDREIEALGVSAVTQEGIAAMEADIERLKNELRALEAFASDPLHRLEKLEGLQLD